MYLSVSLSTDFRKTGYRMESVDLLIDYFSKDFAKEIFLVTKFQTYEH